MTNQELVIPIDIALKRAEDAREEALFEDRVSDFNKYDREAPLLRSAIRRGEQYQVNF